MKGRLVIINPDTGASTAALSPLIMEDTGGIFLCGDDWARPILRPDLGSVTVLDVRKALSLQEESLPEIYLSGIRELPEANPLAPSFLKWVQEWWCEEVNALQGKQSLALAS